MELAQGLLVALAQGLLMALYRRLQRMISNGRMVVPEGESFVLKGVNGESDSISSVCFDFLGVWG